MRRSGCFHIGRDRTARAAVLSLLLCWGPAAAGEPGPEARFLWLELPPAAAAAPSRRPGGRVADEPRFESEHRPQPVRRYVLTPDGVGPGARAWLTAADGTVRDLPLAAGPPAGVRLETPEGDGPLHGGLGVVVIDPVVRDGVLEVRCARWLTLHHQCAWGHHHRHDPQRRILRPLERAPLDITIDDLWDGSFHNALTTGRELVLRVTAHGRPAAGSRLTVTTGGGWTRHLVCDEHGVARVRLIRDHFDADWKDFRRTRQQRLAVTAELTTADGGVLDGLPYATTHATATFSWRYRPGPAQYAARADGLALIALTAAVCGLAVFWYRLRRRRPRPVTALDE